MREDWTVQIFDSPEDAEEAERSENLKRTGVERMRLLPAISTPNAEGSEPGLRGPYQILNRPQR
jgi:hypothetical protein